MPSHETELLIADTILPSPHEVGFAHPTTSFVALDVINRTQYAPLNCRCCPELVMQNRGRLVQLTRGLQNTVSGPRLHAQESDNVAPPCGNWIAEVLCGREAGSTDPSRVSGSPRLLGSPPYASVRVSARHAKLPSVCPATHSLASFSATSMRISPTSISIRQEMMSSGPDLILAWAKYKDGANLH